MIPRKHFGLIFLILIGGIWTNACKEEQQTSGPVIRPVRYQEAYAVGGSRTRVFSGTARAGVESWLSFKVAGTISSIDVQIGDRVKKGQRIAELDPRDYVLQVEEAKENLAQARAQARNAAANHERIRALYENNNVSRNDLDAARAAAESAGALVRSIDKKIEQAELQLKYTRLPAPVDGAIAAVEVEVNENVGTGGHVVLLTSGEVPEVEVAIPEVLIARIKVGSLVTVTFDAIPEKHFPAEVTEVGISSTDFATTFPVTVRLDRRDPGIRPGMAAEVAFRFESTEQKKYFLVPPQSAGEDRRGRFVFVVEPEEEEGFGIIHRRAVQVGELTTEGIEILSGLSDGDRVVIAGVSKIEDGMKVKLASSN